jgi:hypothetical protein
MEYGEAFFYNIVTDLLCAAVYIGGISLCRILEHVFFLVIGLGFIEFRASVRQLFLNLYAILCVYEFAELNNFCEGIVFMLYKAYECGFYGIIRYYKEIVGAISNGKRHGRSAVQIAIK